MVRRNDIDWESVETDYRICQLSIRKIAEKHGTEASSITRRAKKGGWTRDLSEAVRAATRAKVRDAVAQETQRNATECTQSTFSEVDLAANVNATLIMRHQKRAGRMSDLLEKMADEIEQMTGDRELFAKLGEILSSPGVDGNPIVIDKLTDAFHKALSHPSRVDSMKKLADTLRVLIGLERQAFGIDDKEKNNKGHDIEDAIARIAKAAAASGRRVVC